MIPLAKEILKLMLPEDLKLALDHFYLGLSGASLWIGYVVAAIYYLSADKPEVANVICEGSGYGWIVVDTLHVMLDFDKGKESK